MNSHPGKVPVVHFYAPGQVLAPSRDGHIHVEMRVREMEEDTLLLSSLHRLGIPLTNGLLQRLDRRSRRNLLHLVEDMERGEVADAVGELLDFVEDNRALGGPVLDGFSAQLPDGLARTLLRHPGLRTELLNGEPTVRSAVSILLSEPDHLRLAVAEALEAVSEFPALEGYLRSALAVVEPYALHLGCRPVTAFGAPG